MSVVFEPKPGDLHPWLVGMTVACVCSRDVGCRVQWPNDLVFGEDHLKVGGILTELHDGVPIVGIGINLTSGAIPSDLFTKATSLGSTLPPLELAHLITDELIRTDSPQSWDELSPLWFAYDSTPGKRYQLASGETVSAIRIGKIGELIAMDDKGSETRIMAADALFGPRTSPV